jgi:hypothetical protein
MSAVKDWLKEIDTWIRLGTAILTGLSLILFGMGCPPHLKSLGTCLIVVLVFSISLLSAYLFLKKRRIKLKWIFLASSFLLAFLLTLIFVFLRHNYIYVDTRNGTEYVIGSEFVSDDVKKVRQKTPSLQEFHMDGQFDMEAMYSHDSLVRAELTLTLTWFPIFAFLGMTIGSLMAIYPRKRKTSQAPES